MRISKREFKSRNNYIVELNDKVWTNAYLMIIITISPIDFFICKFIGLLKSVPSIISSIVVYLFSAEVNVSLTVSLSSKLKITVSLSDSSMRKSSASFSFYNINNSIRDKKINIYMILFKSVNI